MTLVRDKIVVFYNQNVCTKMDITLIPRKILKLENPRKSSVGI